MKKFFLYTFLLAGLGFGVTGCNNGDYDADPDTNYASGVNPLNPVGGMNTSFNWSGTDPMSAEINGNAWTADDVDMFENPFDDSQWVIGGLNHSSGSDTTMFALYVQKDVEAGKSYFIFVGNTENTASYIAKLNEPSAYFESTMTNLGEIKILENTSTHIKGLFYFLGRSPISKQYINIQKGYFKVPKP